ncbi:hypothetical protein [Kitasatospora sp. GP82]|uniref:hypothetical protein n=1 Tax=Kitasatospora sp. GP82 TaxID=3035089 RepID=UPI002475F5F5|nr:hypothetical protein [Kitasatospora sp. GP82]MDH6123196.1 hypothetical protein [Kitasatospora sp. GP82]
MTNRLKRSAARMAVVGALGVASLAVAVTPALAKGSAELKVSPGTVSLGHSIHLKGDAGDDGVPFGKLCAQERVGTHGAWHTVKCGPITYVNVRDARVDAQVKATHRGTLQFRGVLYGVDGLKGGHPYVARTTEVTSVHVR